MVSFYFINKINNKFENAYFLLQKRRTNCSSEELISKIIRVSEDSRVPKVTLSTKDLEEKKPYAITGIRGLKTTFGMKVLVELEGKYNYFLPERYSKILPKNDDVAITPSNLTMAYHGRGIENSVLLEFKQEVDQEEEEQQEK